MVRRMLRQGFFAALCGFALALAGCSLDAKGDAAKAVAGFLAAAKADDTTAFEAALDRPALRIDLRDQLAALAKSSGLDVNGGPSEFAMDRMITPQLVRRAEAGTGLPDAPTADQIAPALKTVEKGKVCLQDAAKTRCLLTFAKSGKAWRLVGMQATDHPPRP